MPKPPTATPSGWYFFNHHGCPIFAVVPVSCLPGEESYFSVRVLLDLSTDGQWSELIGCTTMAEAMEFVMEEAAR